MKRYCIFFLLLVLLNTNKIAAQKKSDKESLVNDLGKKTILLRDDKDAILGTLPFKHITIIDARFDTTMIGLYESPITSKLNKIVLNLPVSVELNKYISETYTMTPEADSAPSLLVVLKKLWLTSAIDDGFKRDDAANQAWRNGVICCADLFIQTGGIYHTLYRIDTVLTGEYSMISEAHLFVQHAIQSIFGRVLNQGTDVIHAGKKEFSFDAIQQYIKQYHDYKIFSEMSFKKGVYANFSEFKNNNPSFTEFETKQSRVTDNVYVKNEKGDFILSRDYWGFCDEESIFVNSSENIFQLHRSGDTFIMYGFKGFDKKKNLKIGNILFLGFVTGIAGAQNKKIVYKGNKIPLQLDMETGEFY